MPEELFTGISLGEVGAATIPISLVLGCARFDFNYPQVKNCLIMEANEFLHRGAILLENPTIDPQQNPRQ
jgi:3-oxoacyl-[acyl-carrier-protein] synthase-1